MSLSPPWENRGWNLFLRRIAYCKARIAAIIATAMKLAILIWNMINKAEAYKECNYEEINEKR